MHALGIDIGGTGIKAAPVDVTTGKLLADRQKIDTPHPALPDPVADVVKQLTTAFNWSGPVGITFPGVVADGVTRTAANWIRPGSGWTPPRCCQGHRQPGPGAERRRRGRGGRDDVRRRGG